MNYFVRRLVCVRRSISKAERSQLEDSISVSTCTTQCYANANTFS